MTKATLKDILRPVPLFAAALFLLLMGAGSPVYFKSVSVAVLEVAGEGSETMDAVAGDYLRRGRPGPARMLRAGGDEAAPVAERVELYASVFERFPYSRLLGGRTVETARIVQALPMDGLDFLLQRQREAGDAAGVVGTSVLRLLIPAEHRQAVRAYLRDSPNAVVEALLATRGIRNFARLMPVDTTAGQPLDVTILATALLAEGDHLTPMMQRRLRYLATSALEGRAAPLAELERTYMAMLALSQRLNYLQLAEVVGRIDSTDTLVKVAALLREREEDIAEPFSLLVFSQRPQALLNYYETYGASGWEDVGTAAALGRGALDALLDRGLPLYERPRYVRFLELPLHWVEAEVMLTASSESPGWAFTLKLFFLFGAGLCLALAISSVFRGVRRRGWDRENPEEWQQDDPLPRSHPLVLGAHLIFAFVFCAAAWIMLEPSLLEFDGSRQALRLTLDMDFGDVSQILPNINIPQVMFDQVTIITIGIFFALQIAVYVVCLIKISEIKKKKSPAPLKMRLLANEENLFDLGLYVGLGGTVLSLILLVMEVKNVSLIAAYSSTLFGIIFVALLKVLHIRPLRRSLIIKSEYFNYGQDTPTDHL